MQRVYAYVDESGHHNKDELFIVGVVIVEDKRGDIEQVLELIERDTGKGRAKWADAKHDNRIAYMQRIIGLDMFVGRLFYVAYQKVDAPIIEMAARGLAAVWHSYMPNTPIATAFIDGLPRSKVADVSKLLRDSDVVADKVRGVSKEESSALIRLADAVCGLARAASLNRPDAQKILDRATKRGAIKNPHS